MNAISIIQPGLAMVALTFVVWFRMFFSRLGQMKRGRIHPQTVATSAQMSERVLDSRASDNFRNLFELPVLFYFAVVVASITSQVDSLLVGLGWAFVALRVVHSFIHCGYNRVMHRFYAYVMSGFVLLLMWAWLAYGLLS